MENPNLRNLVMYGKPQDELVAALKNLPNGRLVPPGEGHLVKLEYGDTSIYVGEMPDGTLITATVTGQDESGADVPLSEDKLQLLAKDLDAVGISYSWDLSDNDRKKLG
jgi:hypothetical protein